VRVAVARLRSARAGFTLVEVVFALGILLLGAAVVLGLLSFGAALSRTASLRTASAEVLAAVTAELEDELFPLQADGTAGPPRAIAERPVPGRPGLLYSVRATPLGDVGDHGIGIAHPLEYKVEIELSWRSGGLRRARRYETLMLREGPFGERLRQRFVAAQDGSPTDEAP